MFDVDFVNDFLGQLLNEQYVIVWDLKDKREHIKGGAWRWGDPQLAVDEETSEFDVCGISENVVFFLIIEHIPSVSNKLAAPEPHAPYFVTSLGSEYRHDALDVRASRGELEVLHDFVEDVGGVLTMPTISD